MEKKMKKLMLLAALGTAAIFTACSDDSSSSGTASNTLDGKSVVSCDRVQTIAGIENHTCTAIASDDPAAESLKTSCAAVTEFDKTVYTVGEGCAKAELECEVGNTVQYFYGEGMDGFSCDQMAEPAE